MNHIVVGCGYWGKIIIKTFYSMGLKNIFTCDPLSDGFGGHSHFKDYKLIPCHLGDKVFIATPLSTHFDICTFFLKKGLDVFCEKPLCTGVLQAKSLYCLADNFENKLYVDWTFTHNIQVHAIKCFLETGAMGRLTSIYMNRLNDGPAREDASPKEDLASHDVSILSYLFEQYPTNRSWRFYGRIEKGMSPSVVGIIRYGNKYHFTAIINASWNYPVKERKCVFVFEKGVLVWNDMDKTININGKNLALDDDGLPKHQYPLENSIKAFLDLTEEGYKFNRDLTFKVMHLLS